jgi:hypothetical protein
VCDSRAPHHSASNQEESPVPLIWTQHLITFTDTQLRMDKNRDTHIPTTDQVNTPDQPYFTNSKYFPHTILYCLIFRSHRHRSVRPLFPPLWPVTELDRNHRTLSDTCFIYCTYVYQIKIPYTKYRCIGQSTVVHSSSHFYHICMPDDGSPKPKHVALCLLCLK